MLLCVRIGVIFPRILVRKDYAHEVHTFAMDPFFPECFNLVPDALGEFDGGFFSMERPLTTRSLMGDNMCRQSRVSGKRSTNRGGKKEKAVRHRLSSPKEQHNTVIPICLSNAVATRGRMVSATLKVDVDIPIGRWKKKQKQRAPHQQGDPDR